MTFENLPGELDINSANALTSEYSVKSFIHDIVQKLLDVQVSFVPNDNSSLKLYDPLLGKVTSHLNILENLKTDSLYCIWNNFYVYYVIIRYITTEDSLMILGPCLLQEPDDLFYAEIIQKNHLHPSNRSYLEKYYTALPVVNQSTINFSAATCGRFLYGTKVKFNKIELYPDFQISSNSRKSPEYDISAQNLDLIEKHYDLERKLLWELENGNKKEALETYDILYRLIKKNLTIPNALKNMQNYSYSLNTLYQKTTQNCNVHPFHTYPVYHKHMQRINFVHSSYELNEGNIAMLVEYCTMIQSQSSIHYSKQISKVLNYINLNIGSELSLELLADLAALSPNYLSQVFHEETAKTISQYITQKRILLAKDLLERSRMQIKEIANYLGYTDVSYFSRVFKAHAKITPQQYRKKHSLYN